MALTVAEARLEALKLAVRPGLELGSILDTAEAYAKFITSQGVAAEDSPNPVEAVNPVPESRKKGK